MEFENRLIEAIKRHESLYNPNKREHRDITLKEKMWSKIGREMGVPASLCKTRWRSLRDQFVKEHKRVKCQGDVGSKWLYYDDLLFLADFIKARRKRIYSKKTSDAETYKDRGKTAPIFEEDISSESIKIDATTPLRKEKQPKNSTSKIKRNVVLLPSYVDADHDYVDENSDSASESIIAPIKSKEKILSNTKTSPQQSSAIITLMEDIRTDFATFLHNTSKTIENEISRETDEIDEFLKLVKRKFLKLPEDVANETQLEILSILNKAIAENIN